MGIFTDIVTHNIKEREKAYNKEHKNAYTIGETGPIDLDNQYAMLAPYYSFQDFLDNLYSIFYKPIYNLCTALKAFYGMFKIAILGVDGDGQAVSLSERAYYACGNFLLGIYSLTVSMIIDTAASLATLVSRPITTGVVKAVDWYMDEKDYFGYESMEC